MSCAPVNALAKPPGSLVLAAAFPVLRIRTEEIAVRGKRILSDGREFLNKAFDFIERKGVNWTTLCWFSDSMQEIELLL